MLAPLLLLAIGLGLFGAPLRRHPAASARRSLAGLARDLRRDPGRSRRPAGLLALGSLACGAVFLPALALAVLRLAPPAAARWWLAAASLLLALATLGNWLLVRLSRSTFGFGPGQPDDATWAARLQPGFLVAATAVAGLGAAVPAVAQWLRAA